MDSNLMSRKHSRGRDDCATRASSEYGASLKKFPPKVIRSEKENEEYAEVLDDLDSRHKKLTHAEKELADLLTLLIEDFEGKRTRCLARSLWMS